MKTPPIQVNWYVHIALATWKVEAESSREPKSLKSSLAILTKPIRAWVGSSEGAQMVAQASEYGKGIKHAVCRGTLWFVEKPYVEPESQVTR